MRLNTYVDLGSQEVSVDLDGSDIVACMLGEQADGRTTDELVKRWLNAVAAFINALTPSDIERLSPAVRGVIYAFGVKVADRFRPREQDG